jgi:integrase
LILIVRRSTSKKKPAGLRRSWILRKTHEGKRKRIGLGPFPAISLAAARLKAIEAVNGLSDGNDPTRRGRARRRAQMEARTLTFARAVDLYFGEAARRYKNPKSEAIRTRALRTLCSALNDKPIEEISTREIAAVLKPLARETGRKTLGALRAVFDLAMVEMEQRGMSMRNPASPDLMKAVGYASTSRNSHNHFPALDHREVAAFMAALGKIRTSAAYCLQFIVLTASRSGAARLARFDQIDLEARLWRCPAEQMKDSNHRSGVFVVPLSPAAITAVEAMRELNAKRAIPSPFVFAADDDGPISENKLTTLARTLRRKGDWRDPDTGKPIVIHGLRATFRTWVETTRRQDRDIAELAMGHKVHGDVERRYVRDGLIDERRALLLDWARHCAGENTYAAVIPVRRL